MSKRSPSYPRRDLKSAIDFADEIRKNLGMDLVTRVQIADYKGVAESNGSLAMYISSCEQFGLFNMERGEGVKISKLAKRIMIPLTGKDKQTALIESVHSPEIFASVFEKFKGQALPDNLQNILIHQFGFEPKGAQHCVGVLHRSLQYANAIENERVIFPGEEKNSRFSPSYFSQTEAVEAEIVDEVHTSLSTEEGKSPIKLLEIPMLLGPSRFAYLKLPEDINDKEVKILIKRIENEISVLNEIRADAEDL